MRGDTKTVTTTTTISLERRVETYVDGVLDDTDYEYDTDYETFTRDYVWVSTGWVLSSSSGSAGNLTGREWEQYQVDLGNYSIYQSTGKQPATSLLSEAASSVWGFTDKVFGFSEAASTCSSGWSWKCAGSVASTGLKVLGAAAVVAASVVMLPVMAGAVATGSVIGAATALSAATLTSATVAMSAAVITSAAVSAAYAGASAYSAGYRWDDLAAMTLGGGLEGAGITALTLAPLAYNEYRRNQPLPDAPPEGTTANGNYHHYDQLNGGPEGSERLPSKLKAMYPDTQFLMKRQGEKGVDVTVTGGKHPSLYPNSPWQPGVNTADFKPGKPSGYNQFARDIRTGKIPAGSHFIGYNPKTGQLTGAFDQSAGFAPGMLTSPGFYAGPAMAASVSIPAPSQAIVAPRVDPFMTEPQMTEW